MKTLVFWTDGSAAPNPGPGGYAVLDANGRPLALGAENPSTNIRMEAHAILAALKLANKKPCEIHTDSQFWINVLEKWAPIWQKNHWTKKSGAIQNLDLVKQLYNAYLKSGTKLIWVPGHRNYKLNELADFYANRAREGLTLQNL